MKKGASFSTQVLGGQRDNSEDPGVPVSCEQILQIAIQVYEAVAPYLADMEWPFPAVYLAYIRTRIALHAIRVIY